MTPTTGVTEPPGEDRARATYAREGQEVVELHEPIAREMAEPRDGHEPAPLWVVFAMMALLGWGGWYLGTYSGGFESSVYDERGAVGRAAAPAPEPVDPMVLGRRTYANCQACHQADGSGVPGNFPALAGSPWVAGDPAMLAGMVLHGLQGEWVSRGATYNQVMPGWGHLSDEQIAAVLTYVRSSFGNQAPAVTPELVAGVRETTRGRRQPFTAGQLQELAVPEAGRAPRSGAGE